jgi:hypothetical protein
MLERMEGISFILQAEIQEQNTPFQIAIHDREEDL